jgi:lambda repressor-like predicted transcriptional regulator
MVRRADPAPASRPPVRVLAVDDWAWRRGHRYGTVLVDLERNRVLDLLPDRQAETLAAWLRQHPGIEVVARDRAGAYADGVRQGAPDAIQVSDRWHLLRNLSDAVHAITDRHHAAVRRIGREVMVHLSAEDARSTPVAPRPNLAFRRAEAARARRQARFDEAVRLHAAGASLSAISRQVGADRKTLRQWLQAGAMPTWRRPRRAAVSSSPTESIWSGAGRRAAATRLGCGASSWQWASLADPPSYGPGPRSGAGADPRPEGCRSWPMANPGGHRRAAASPVC